MGFKRTAEGRVFFDNPDENPPGRDSERQHQAESKDIQIVGLLRALNDRLKDDKAERSRLLRELAEYREVIDDLEDRTGRSEDAYIDLEQKISARQNENAKKASRAENIAKETLKEVLDTRNMLGEMQEKTQLSSKSFSVIKSQIDDTRKAGDVIRKRQAVLEKLHKEQNEKMVGSVAAYVTLTKRLTESEMRYEQIDNRIEETGVAQRQLERKLEKAGEDRLRFLRKMDRIEETVIQTRDALNAKAMVVLADQAAPAAPEPPALAAQPSPREPDPVMLEKRAGISFAWLQKIKAVPATGLATIVLAVLLSGIFILVIELSGPLIEKFSLFDKTEETKWQQVYQEGSVTRPDEAGAKPRIIYQQPRSENQNNAREEIVEEKVSGVEQVPDSERFATPSESEIPIAPVAAKAYIPDDIGTLDINDQDKLLAALENDADAVAAMMNEIEPGHVDESAEMQQAGLDTKDVVPSYVIEEPAIEESAPLSPRPGLQGRIKPDPNLPEVVKKIEQEAFAGVAEAQHDLAAIYTAGHGGTRQDYQRAAQWFQEAAEGGVANARYNLGVLYHQGMGVERDIKKAITWYESAAQLGHPEAQYNLGIAYIEGIGVAYAPRRAAHYFESAADSGITEAAYNLGLIYENGLLGKAEPDTALMWYKTASDQDSPEAKAALEQLAKSLDIKISDVNRIVENMVAADAKDSAPVQSAAAKTVVRKESPSAPAAQSLRTGRVASVPKVVSQKEQARVLTVQIQKYLMQLGLYPGPSDGLGGPLTVDAIRSYQIFHEIEASGRASEKLHAYKKGDPQINEVGSRTQ